MGSPLFAGFGREGTFRDRSGSGGTPARVMVLAESRQWSKPGRSRLAVAP